MSTSPYTRSADETADAFPARLSVAPQTAGDALEVCDATNAAPPAIVVRGLPNLRAFVDGPGQLFSTASLSRA